MFLRQFFRPNVDKMIEKKDVDGLIKVLNDREPEIRLAAVQGLGNMGYSRTVTPICNMLKDEEWAIREAAALALMRIGDARAIQPLILTLRDQTQVVNQAVSDALLKIGKPAVNPLMGALRDNDPWVRQAAAKILGQANDAHVVRALGDLIKDPEWKVRQVAIEALSNYGQAAAEPLQGALVDDNPVVRETAAKALDKVGVPSDPAAQAWYAVSKGDFGTAVKLGNVAVEPLIAALQDKSVDMRRSAARALGEIGDARAIKPLMALLRDPEWLVREAVSESLPAIFDPTLADQLLGMLGDPDVGVREATVRTLGHIGDERAIGPLITALSDMEWQVADTAAEALVNLGDPVVEPLIEAVRKGGPSLRRYAGQVFDKVGVPDDPVYRAWFAVMRADWEYARSFGDLALEPLFAALKDDDHRTRKAAAETLGQIGDARAVAPLCAALKDRKADVRETITEVLMRMGPVALQALISALSSIDGATRMAAARVLGEVGDQRVIEPLSQALMDPDTRVSEAAAESLEKLGVPHDPNIEAWFAVARRDWDTAKRMRQRAVWPLCNALNHHDPNARQEAARALGDIGDHDAIDALREALKDDEWYVGEAASIALSKMGVDATVELEAARAAAMEASIAVPTRAIEGEEPA